MIRCRAVTLRHEGAADGAPRCLVFVHAHPDDEALGTGGTIARYAADGRHVCVVTCTNGELGEVAEVSDLGPVDDVRRRLGEIRAAELVEACRRLGPVDVRMLGFHDSGMAGTPDNDDPKVFVNQELDDVVRKIVAIIRELRPQVLVTYNEIGLYGHPDHIRAHEAALKSVDAAADPSYGPGEPHRVAKVYYTAVPKSLLRMGRELWRELGAGDPDEFFAEEEIERIAADDAAITSFIDVSGYVDRKFHALEAHRTQLGTTERFLGIPKEYRNLAFGTECYVRVRPNGTSAERETDLFEGLTSRPEGTGRP